MAYTASGKIHLVGDTQTFKSGFSKRELVIETADKFPQLVKFDFLKEKGDLLDGLKPGDEVTIHFDIGGREYNGRYFVDLKGWKIDKGAPADSSATPPEPEDTTDYSQDSGDEDIPF
ncbi:MAG: DUF3127 domain-containing protein [Opitutales bacterium]